jgi:DNA-binding MarR family transcriptional regulator
VSDNDRPVGAAFLLSQLGSHAAAKFAERVADYDLTPADCGLLRLLHGRPGSSQQEVAELLGMQPSRVVALVDTLEAAGFVRRVRDDADRRRNAVELTDAGQQILRTVGRVAKAHESAICAALSPAERRTLIGLLERIAAEQHLTAGVHPGYRTLRPSRAGASTRSR